MDLQHLGSDAMKRLCVREVVVSSVNIQAKKILLDTEGIKNVFVLQQEIEKRIDCFGSSKFSDSIRGRICELLVG